MRIGYKIFQADIDLIVINNTCLVIQNVKRRYPS